MSARHRPWEDAADFSIGLKPIAAADWLEGGEADPAARKDALLGSVRDLVWAEVEDSRPAQAEVLALVEGALGRSVDDADRPPLLAAARAVPDDLCLMEKRDGEWRLTALSLSAGSFFTASDVIGRSLRELHAPVTGFQERLLTRVTRIFESLRPDLVLERRNWSVVSSDALHAPDPAPMRAAIQELDPGRAPELLFTRVERQTLRRLPASGGALFTIRVWLTPLGEVLADPEGRARFARAWRAASPDFRAYKKLGLYDGLVEPLLG